MARIGIRTVLVMAFLIALLGAAGWVLAGELGLVVFALIGLAIDLGVYWFSDRIALAAHHATLLPESAAPDVHRIVGELAARASIPTPPIYLIPSDHPNAFAAGRGPGHAVIAVTRGLVDLLGERELRGVLAHELSHIKNGRAREYGADDAGARLTRDPDGLASALGKLEAWSAHRPYERFAPATAHLFIVNPSHPRIEDRIARLRELDCRVRHF